MKHMLNQIIKYIFGLLIDFNTRHLNLKQDSDEDIDVKKELLSLMFGYE